MTHGTFSATDLDRSTPTPPGRRAQNAALFAFAGGGGNAYSCFPPYHLAGVQAFTILPIFYGSTAVFGPADIPANARLVTEIMRQVKLKAIYVPPAILESWVRLPGSLEQAATLDFVLYGGGPLSPMVGKALDEVCNLCQVYGSAEIGQVQLLIPLKGNWAHIEPNPYEEIDMQFSKHHGAYEMVLHRNPDLNRRRSLYYNFPQVGTWRTGDLFLPVAGNPGVWDFYGRADDLILLSNGHKINPAAIEAYLLGHSLVSGALVAGSGRPYPAIVLELQSGAIEKRWSWLIECIWPIIEEVNRSLPSYSQILRSMILFASIEKPFIRAPKGSIVRKTTLDIYAEELDKLYSSPAGAESVGSNTVEDMILVTIRRFVSASVKSVLPDIDVSHTDNLFNKGLDSLKMIELRNVLRKGFRNDGSFNRSTFALDTIYDNPSISDLAEAIYAILIQRASDSPKVLRTSQPQNLIDHYTNDLKDENDKEAPLTVLLTGSTGFLGRHVLRKLLEDPQIARIYCLSRLSNGRANHIRMFRHEQGMDHTNWMKVRFLRVDLGQEQLGLSDKVWRKLGKTIHIIIHLAWKVDFSLPLDYYEKHHIRSLRTIIDLSRDGRHRPRIVFVSSSSTMSNWHLVHGFSPVPEALSDDHETALQVGYSQSKLVAEHMLGIASSHCNIPVTIFRVGQIAGAVSDHPMSLWPPNELVPLVLQTSKNMGLLPSFNAYCDWIPVDTVAQIMHELLFPTQREVQAMESTPKQSSAEVYNLVNPHCIHWSTLNTIIQEHLGEHIQAITLTDWIEVLKADIGCDSVTTVSKPALKILPFLETLAEKDIQQEPRYLSFDTTNGTRGSKTMAQLQPVSEEWIHKWIKQWGI
ncbi:MAG: hypothetical protein Q9213_000161 [Squamulea squamosa]